MPDAPGPVNLAAAASIDAEGESRPPAHCVAGGRYIGAPGFEPGTSPTRTARATRLRHAPRYWASLLGRARDGLVVAHRQTGDQRLERGVERRVLALRPAGEPLVLDRLRLGDDVVEQVRVAVGEERADRVEPGVGERAEEVGVGLAAHGPPPSRDPVASFTPWVTWSTVPPTACPVCLTAPPAWPPMVSPTTSVAPETTPPAVGGGELAAGWVSGAREGLTSGSDEPVAVWVAASAASVTAPVAPPVAPDAARVVGCHGDDVG